MDKIHSQGTVPSNSKNTFNQSKHIGAIHNSNLASWCLMRGETIAIPKIGPLEERVLTYLVDKILAAKPGADTSYIQEDLEWMVCNLYGLTDEEREAVATSQRGELPPLTREEEDTAMLRAIDRVKKWEKDEEFLKHEEMMRELLGWDERCVRPGIPPGLEAGD